MDRITACSIGQDSLRILRHLLSPEPVNRQGNTPCGPSWKAQPGLCEYERAWCYLVKAQATCCREFPCFPYLKASFLPYPSCLTAALSATSLASAVYLVSKSSAKDCLTVCTLISENCLSFILCNRSCCNCSSYRKSSQTDPEEQELEPPKQAQCVTTQ